MVGQLDGWRNRGRGLFGGSGYGLGAGGVEQARDEVGRSWCRWCFFVCGEER